jgi:hypothetical protein
MTPNKTIEQTPLPQEIRDLLDRYHQDALSGEHCVACSSACCSQGGFALLENVIQIYELYSAGRLKRADYQFKPGLGFADFVFTYFDIRSFVAGGQEMLMFHMRNLTPDGRVIGIPQEDGSYWETRQRLFNENKGMNAGCAFLNQKLPADGGDTNTQRQCILHREHALDAITQKPIDCVFFTCAQEMGKYKKPSADESQEWFGLLAKHYPGSVARFKDRLEAGKR